LCAKKCINFLQKGSQNLSVDDDGGVRITKLIGFFVGLVHVQFISIVSHYNVFPTPMMVSPSGKKLQATQQALDFPDISNMVG
jgi:hypothetical protein